MLAALVVLLRTLGLLCSGHRAIALENVTGTYSAAVSPGMGITEVITSPSSPWQNPYAERLIGSIRRECLDHVIVLRERHLRCLLTAYLTYYHGARTHLALEKDAPTTRRVQTPTEGPVVAVPEVGGLHHRYERRAA